VEINSRCGRGETIYDPWHYVPVVARKPGAAVEAACAQAISEGVRSADVIINILARQRDPGPVAPIFTPAVLKLRHEPVADCARYDQLRRA
jgi:hypothetical protein